MRRWAQSGLLLVMLAAASKAQPQFVHGDECLFCHRVDIGRTWQNNSHGVTMRQREDAPDLIKKLAADPAMKQFETQVTHTLGSRHTVRYLKKSGYGKQDLLSPELGWQKDKFAKQCAGCHATAVDSKTLAYSEVGIDCYACHGLVDLDHSNDTSKIFLSKKRRSDVMAITMTCAQCHLRGGKSRATGLPWPDNYTAGGDLFKDYDVDFARADDPQLNAGDRHVWKNVRDVVKNSGDVSCISCHRIHENSSSRHRRVLTSAICLECHNADGPKKALKSYTVHSTLCEY